VTDVVWDGNDLESVQKSGEMVALVRRFESSLALAFESVDSSSIV